MSKNWNSLMKLAKSNLSDHKRKIVNSLILKDNHDKDIISSLIHNNVDSTDAFNWILQLRNYWNGDSYVSCMETRLPYDYEYFKNCDRLVMTPLTDKCYITLMTAIKLNLGGAPMGPAGSGKT